MHCQDRNQEADLETDDCHEEIQLSEEDNLYGDCHRQKQQKSDCECCLRQLDENVADRDHSLIWMLVSGTSPETVDLWSLETLRVEEEENREVEILSCWMSWLRGAHLYSLLSLLTLINTQPHRHCALVHY